MSPVFWTHSVVHDVDAGSNQKLFSGPGFICSWRWSFDLVTECVNFVVKIVTLDYENIMGARTGPKKHCEPVGNRKQATVKELPQVSEHSLSIQR